jgi:hypothetical protein
MIRAAEHADIERVVDLGQMLHEASTFSAVAFSRKKVTNLMHSLIDGAGALFVAERDGELIGGIAGGVSLYWFSDTDKLAFDYAFFIDPTKRNGITALKLIAALKIWARGQGARELKMGITTGMNVEQMSEFYLMAGFVPVGPIFSMEL